MATEHERPTLDGAEPLGITELLARVGDDNVRMQNIRGCADDFTVRGKGPRAVTMIRFGTTAMTPGDALHGTGPVGLILWIPAALVEKALADHRAGVAPPTVGQAPADADRP